MADYHAYKDFKFKAETLELIETISNVIDNYQLQGFDLTLRQLYYQLVSRNIIPNNEKSYDRIGEIVANGRLAGLLPWDAIVDRTRFLRENSHWYSPSSIIRSAANSYYKDRWENQDYYVEVWIEKDALVGVLDGICSELDVPYFSCRGYTSLSELYTAAQRIREKSDEGKEVIVIHLGDHDPSGIDMSRDIEDRLRMLSDYADLEVERIALNMDQVQQYNPPPNPAKLTDSRASGYIAAYGRSSWELDALEPTVISDLIRDKVYEYRDPDKLAEVEQEEEYERKHLTLAAQRWTDVVAFLTAPKQESEDE